MDPLKSIITIFNIVAIQYCSNACETNVLCDQGIPITICEIELVKPAFSTFNALNISSSFRVTSELTHLIVICF